MTLPKPVAGLVVRRASDGAIEAIVAPITHAAPGADQSGIELPPSVCRQIGLDGERQWLRSDELNAFVWPGFDLRKIPGSENFAYGMLPKDVFERLRKQIVERRRTGKAKLTARD